jgi:hypothetical protein
MDIDQTLDSRFRQAVACIDAGDVEAVEPAKDYSQIIAYLRQRLRS